MASDAVLEVISDVLILLSLPIIITAWAICYVSERIAERIVWWML